MARGSVWIWLWCGTDAWGSGWSMPSSRLHGCPRRASSELHAQPPGEPLNSFIAYAQISASVSQQPEDLQQAASGLIDGYWRFILLFGKRKRFILRNSFNYMNCWRKFVSWWSLEILMILATNIFLLEDWDKLSNLQCNKMVCVCDYDRSPLSSWKLQSLIAGNECGLPKLDVKRSEKGGAYKRLN